MSLGITNIIFQQDLAKITDPGQENYLSISNKENMQSQIFYI